jgi:hypothetical protein
LGNAQIKVETQWAHYPLGLWPTGNKKTPGPIAQGVSTYFRHFMSVSSKQGSFIKLNAKSEVVKEKCKKHRHLYQTTKKIFLYSKGF